MEKKKLDEVYSYSMPPVQIVALYTEPIPRYMYNRPYHASEDCVRVHQNRHSHPDPNRVNDKKTLPL